MSSTNMSMPGGDSKSKKKKKSRKKGNNKDAAAPTTPTATSVETPETDVPKETFESEDSDPAEQEDETEQQQQRQEPKEPPPAAELVNGFARPTKEDDHDDDENGDGEDNDDEPTARFEALVKDRDTLRLEVTQLRRELEELRSKHVGEVEAVRGELAETLAEKESAEEQYQSLLGKVNTIRSQLGERLKADAEDLAQARTRIEELEEQRADLQERYTARSAEVEELSARNHELDDKTHEQSKELSTLRNRLTLAQQNWTRERDELLEQEAYVRDEFENAKQAMHDWEVLAMEERNLRKDLTEKTADLEEQLATLKEAHEKSTAERDVHANAVEGLQRALQEIQTVRKQELKELVETNEREQDALRQQLQTLQATHETTSSKLEQTQRELERALPFEKEVKEKNLLIGKLRHEAVILNDHLTKALRYLKKGKPEDNVDRHIVTNHFLHFLALDRSDPKKFQVLQLIAALLGWTDEQREQAGLARPGTGGGTSSSLRLPGSPLVHRTPSTPLLHNDYFGPDSVMSPGSKESLAELWQNFLEHEAAGPAGATTSKTHKSRQSSQSTTVSAAPPPPPPPPPPK